MNTDIKISELKSLIKKELRPYISNECVFYELPYHNNVGDLLIWKGTKQFIKENNIKCLNYSSRWTYKYRKLDNNVTILLNGGGSFGDIWRPCQDFRLKVVNDFPNNPILILPQTVFYKDKQCLLEDARIMSEHNNITICARDIESYNILKEYFYKNNIIMVPDMAFYIDTAELRHYMKNPLKRTLVVERKDKEKVDIDINKLKFHNTIVDYRDWPCMESNTLMTTIGNKLIGFHRHYGSSLDNIIDIFFDKIYRDNLINLGIRFVSSYDEIYTTRLHVAISCILLGKNFYFLNNSYGKNKNFYDTWLKNFDCVKYID